MTGRHMKRRAGPSGVTVVAMAVLVTAVVITAEAGRADEAVDEAAREWVVEPYTGSTLRAETREAFGEYARIVGFSDGKNEVEIQQGRLWRRVLDNPKGRSTLEMVSNYREALSAHGFTVEYECSGRSGCGAIAQPSWNAINGINTGIVPDVRYLTASRRDGETRTTVSVAVIPNRTWIDVVATAEMRLDQVVVDARVLGEALDREGRVVLEQIFFETAKATLLPQSTAALEQIADLLAQHPDWAEVWIVGHTDSRGDFAFNERLARERAEAVRVALIERHGVRADRLRTFGVGPLAPRASHQTEAGQVLNRRVELVLP